MLLSSVCLFSLHMPAPFPTLDLYLSLYTLPPYLLLQAPQRSAVPLGISLRLQAAKSITPCYQATLGTVCGCLSSLAQQPPADTCPLSHEYQGHQRKVTSFHSTLSIFLEFALHATEASLVPPCPDDCSNMETVSCPPCLPLHFSLFTTTGSDSSQKNEKKIPHFCPFFSLSSLPPLLQAPKLHGCTPPFSSNARSIVRFYNHTSSHRMG